MVSRRKFVSTGAVIALAGCTGGGDDDSSNSGGGATDSDGDGVADTEDDFPSDSTRSKLLNRGTEAYDLNEDYYQHLEFSPSESATLSYQAEVQSDVPIDVILTDSTNFRYFEDGTDWEYYGEGSELDTLHANSEMQLSSQKEYYLIIDNTNEGRAEPPTNFDNDRVEVQVSYELYS